ncbi:hypothetical protein [Sphingomonas sp.]|uniref:hypothetical protein n=1 Tax=Sphingomonas sp. TaxID=28214 RepID=UPI0038A537CE
MKNRSRKTEALPTRPAPVSLKPLSTDEASQALFQTTPAKPTTDEPDDRAFK